VGRIPNSQWRPSAIAIIAEWSASLVYIIQLRRNPYIVDINFPVKAYNLNASQNNSSSIATTATLYYASSVAQQTFYSNLQMLTSLSPPTGVCTSSPGYPAYGGAMASTTIGPFVPPFTTK
jgi:hypothetical protein